MSDVTRATFTCNDVRLESGVVLPEVTLAYVTRGRLGADGRGYA